MSCDDPCDNTQPPISGTKISQLGRLQPIADHDLFVVVDISNGETKNTEYLDVIHYSNSGTSLTATTYQNAITELDYIINNTSNISNHNDLSGLQGGTSAGDEYYHLDYTNYNFLIDLANNGTGLVASGGSTGEVLTKKSNNDYDYEWTSVSGTSGIGVTDVTSAGTYMRSTGVWVYSNIFNSSDYYNSIDIDTMLTNYAPVSAINSLSASVDNNTTNIYNVSADLNNHISATDNPHKTSYLNLTDTDNITYSGYGGYTVNVNNTENGLVFTPPKDSNTNAPYIYRLPTVTISNGEFNTNSIIHTNVDHIYINKYDNNGLDRSDGLNAIIKSDLIFINNGIQFANYKVISAGVSWNGDIAEFAVSPLSNSGVFNDKDEIYVELLFRGASTFDELSDTPINKVGSAGKFVAVNTTENSLEYVSIAIPPLSAVTNVGRITEDDIVVGTSTGVNVTITDGNGGGYPGVTMRRAGQEAYVLFDEPNERISINRNLRGRVVYTPTSGTDYIQYDTLINALSGVPTGYWTSGVSISGNTRLFPTMEYDQVDIGVQGGVDLGGQLNVESEVTISGDIEIVGSDNPNANVVYTETSPGSNKWVNNNSYYVYMLDANTWIVSSDDDPTNYNAIIAYKQYNISIPTGVYFGYNGHSNLSISDDSGNIYNDAIATKGSIYASDSIKTSNRFKVGSTVVISDINDVSDDFGGILLSGKASGTGDKLIVADNTNVVMRIGSDGGVYSPECSISDINTVTSATDKILTTKEWVLLDKLGTSALNNLVKGDEGNGDGYWLITDDRNNKGDIGEGALDFSSHTSPSTNYGATGSHSTAFGLSTIASGDYSFANGYISVATGKHAHAEGVNTEATGDNSHSDGESTNASGDNSHTEGAQTKAKAYASHAEGDSTVANAMGSHTEGIYTVTNIGADYSHAEGNYSETKGKYSHAEGSHTEASGVSSHAEGSNTKSNGIDSHAEGRETEANGNYSHAEGYQSISDGLYSHAEGENTHTIGTHSHSEGRNTIADGDYSHSEGLATEANGVGSHSMGYNTHAEGDYSLAIGKYNIGNSDTIFEIGVGDSSGKLNAFQVKNDGKEILLPQLTNADINSSTDDSAVTKGWVVSYNNGYVKGPSSSVINNIALFDNTTGTLIKDSGHTNLSAVWNAGSLVGHPIITGSIPNNGDMLVYNSSSHQWEYTPNPATSPLSGPTSGRPSNAATGVRYFSTDLGYPIYFNGTNWVNGTGAYVIGPN